MRNPLLALAAAVWIGAAAVILATGNPDPVFRLACAAAVASVAVVARRSAFALAPIGLAVGVVSAALHVLPIAAGPVHAVATERAVTTLIGRVAADPVSASSRNALDWSPRQAWVVRVDVVQVTARGRTVRGHVPVVAFVTGSAPPLGSLVRVTGRLSPESAGRGVAATMTVAEVSVIRGPPRYQAWALSLRAALHRALARTPADARQLVPGLALGDTSALDRQLADQMRAAGLSHLTAVSGANVALVIAGAMLLTRGRRRPVRVAATLVAIAAFTVLVRPQPSVVRAAAMGAVVAVAVLARRRTDAMAALATAVVVLVVWDPWLATSYGFMLSVLATAGLIVMPVRPQRWWSALLAATVCAQLAVLPVTVALGSPVTLASVPANLVGVPLAAPAMVLGLATCMSAVVWPALGAVVAWLAALPAVAIAVTARTAAGWDAAALPWPTGPVGVAAACTLTMWCAWHAVRWRLLSGDQRALAAVATAVVVAGCLHPPDPGAPAWPPRGWAMVQCDVGQGDATVVRVAAHRAVVIDTGPEPAAVDRCLRRLQVTVVPLLVLTHFHADHVGGIEGVLHRRAVGTVAVTALDDPPGMSQFVRRALAHRRIAIERVTYPSTVQVGPLQLHCVWPARLIRGQGSDPNNASVVLRFDIDGVRFLLPGDIEPPAQEALATMVGRVDVMKIPHHGSAHQSAVFANAVRPQLVTVSVGAGNDYGHPAASALALYLALGSRIARTDESGDIAVVLRDGHPSLVRRARHT